MTKKEDAFNESCIESYFCRKVENYKLQDKKANREIPKNGYMNAEWFIKISTINVITVVAVLY